MQSITKKARAARIKLIHETVRSQSVAMIEMQRKLSAAGLYETMHAVNKASQKLGWEVVEQLKRQNVTAGCQFVSKVTRNKCSRILGHAGPHAVR